MVLELRDENGELRAMLETLRREGGVGPGTDEAARTAIDAKYLTVTNRWPLAPGERPTGLSMDRAKRRLFATCGNGKMVVLDADSGKVLATPTIGKGTDASVFDAAAGLAFSSNGGEPAYTAYADWRE